jgi:hypothetical protein
MTYTGQQTLPEGKTQYLVSAEHNGKKISLAPVMFESDYNQSVMRNPDYVSSLLGDFYLEPVSLENDETAAAENMIVLTKGEPIYYGPAEITFVRFDMPSHDQGGMMGGTSMTIGALLQVKVGSDVQTVIPQTTYSGQAQPKMTPAYLKSGHLGFELVGMDIASGANKSQIHLNILSDKSMMHGMISKPETLVAEVSVKPFMSLVWIAAGLIILGLCLAMIRRSRKIA